MTNLEAINELKMNCTCCIHLQDKEYCKKSCEIGIAAYCLKKSIPKKIIWKSSRADGFSWSDAYCPTCQRKLQDYEKHHCECGQALEV